MANKLALLPRLGRVAVRGLPLLLTMFLVLIAVVPSHMPGLESVGPLLSVICVYFWTVTSPGSIGYGSSFAIGLFEDLLNGLPLGVSAMSLLLMYGLVDGQTRFLRGQPFVFIWCAFVLVAAMTLVLRWVAVSLIWGRAPDISTVVANCAATAAFFPVASWALWKAQLHYEDALE